MEDPLHKTSATTRRCAGLGGQDRRLAYRCSVCRNEILGQSVGAKSELKGRCNVLTPARRPKLRGLVPLDIVWVARQRSPQLASRDRLPGPLAPLLLNAGAMYHSVVMDAREKMNVALGRTSLVVAASDGRGG